MRPSTLSWSAALVLGLTAVIALTGVPLRTGDVSAADSSVPSYTSDLALNGTGPAAADRGTVFTDVFTVVNLGPAMATNVVVSIPVPLALSFSKIASDTACSLVDAKVVCTLPVIGVNMSRALSVAFRTAAQDNCSPFVYAIEATVQADQSDTVAVNNSASPVLTTILCVAAPSECTDGIDNDRDGTIDALDPGCTIVGSESESLDESQKALAQELAREQARLAARLHTISSSSRSSSSRSSSSRSSAAVAAHSSSRSSRAPLQQDVRVTAQTARDAVIPGETVGAVVTVRNVSGHALKNVQVQFTYDSSQMSVLAGGGTGSAGVYTWTTDLATGQVKAFRFKLVMSSTFKPGSVAVGSVHVLGVKDSPTASLVLPVIAQLPQTGAGGFTSALEDTRRFLVTAAAGSGAAVALFWLVAMTGVTAGGLLGRKIASKD